MKKVFTANFLGFASMALAAVALTTSGCVSSDTPTGGGGDNSGGVVGSGGNSEGSGGSSANSGGSSADTGGTKGSGGTAASNGGSTATGGTKSSGGTTASNSGSTTATGGMTGSGGTTAGIGGSTAVTGGTTSSGGTTASNSASTAVTGGITGAGGMTGSGGTTASIGGSMATTGGTTTGTNGGSSMGTGGTTSPAGTGAPKTTADIIGPGGATSGNVNGTHGDSWICLLSYPNAGENVTGAWFAYSWTATACQTLTIPGGGGPPLCFKGGNCTGATPGAGLGFSVCDVHGVNTLTWPQMQALITTGGLSTTTASTFSQCNAGAKITGVNWTLASGSIPAGTTLDFSDVSDQPLGSVSIAAGATSVSVPATFDASKIARIKFQMNGTAIKTWDFCFQKLTLSYQ